jgi:hypothetical protein
MPDAKWSSLAAAGLMIRQLEANQFRTLTVIDVSSLKHVHANLNEEVHIRKSGRGMGMVLHFFVPRRQIFGGETVTSELRMSDSDEHSRHPIVVGHDS